MSHARLFTLLFILMALAGCAAPVIMGAAAASAVVVNQDERSAGAMAADESIELKSADLVQQDPQLKDSAHLNFTCVNGVVLITGETPASEPLTRLQTGIGKLDKVREVRNEAITAPASSMNSRSQDSWITTKVKTRMVAEKNLRTNRIKVITERQNVYLMGVVTKHEGFVAGVIARDIEGVKRVVKMFEYIDQAS